MARAALAEATLAYAGCAARGNGPPAREAEGTAGASPQGAACVSCHRDVTPSVVAEWGYQGLRVNGMGRHAADTQAWREDRLTILTALGVPSPDRAPTDRLEAFETILSFITGRAQELRERHAAKEARDHASDR